MVRAIKANQPEAKVSVLIYKGTEGILVYQREIDEIILIDRKEIKDGALIKKIQYDLNIWKTVYKKRFDLVIDLTSSDRSAFISLISRAPVRIGAPLHNPLERLAYHQLIKANPKEMHIVDYQLASLNALGFSIPEADTQIAVPEETTAKVRERWGLGIQGKPLVIIHPGARRPLRRWREDRFAQIADRLIRTYHAYILLIGGPGEKESLDRVERHMNQKPEAKATSLPLIEVAALLRFARLFIGNDTATGHIAAGVGTAHIILFGPNFPHIWAPRGEKGISIFKAPDCCGCRQITCIKKENPCMDWITVEDVWNAAVRLL